MTTYHNFDSISSSTTFNGFTHSLKSLKIGENINTLDFAQTQIMWRNGVEYMKKIASLKRIQKSKSITLSFLSANWNNLQGSKILWFYKLIWY